jgi:RNA polymerase sigma-70 factor, ECF subfamily
VRRGISARILRVDAVAENEKMFPKEIVLERYESEATLAEREALSEQIRTDKEKAFDRLFEQYHSMVFHLAFRILGDREEALDVAQEVFFTIYRKMHSFRGESSLKTWIFRIAINRASNRCRWWNRLRRRGTVSLDEHLGRNRTPDLSETLEAEGNSPEEALLLQEKRTEIERSLHRLPINQRIAVVMRDVEGMAYEEIAEAMQVSLGTVKSRIARGREELKRRLNGELG